MILQRLKLLAAPLGWGLLRATVRLHPAPADPAGGAGIYACLHRDILPAILHVRRARPVLMVSPSPDGDILIRALGRDDYGFVRGASGEDGGRAFVRLRRLVQDGRSAGLAVDGPKGPYGTVHEGVLQLARLTGAPIRPLRARARRSLVLDTWDRTVVPLPFSSVTMEAGPEISLPAAAGPAELERAREALAAFFAAGEDMP